MVQLAVMVVQVLAAQVTVVRPELVVQVAMAVPVVTAAMVVARLPAVPVATVATVVWVALLQLQLSLLPLPVLAVLVAMAVTQKAVMPVATLFPTPSVAAVFPMVQVSSL